MDKDIYKLIVIGVVALSLTCALGVSTLAHTDKVVPEVLSFVLSSSIGGLIGVLSQPKSSKEP